MLGARFVPARNRTTYPPQEKNPKDERHEDEGVFSFDPRGSASCCGSFTSKGS